MSRIKFEGDGLFGRGESPQDGIQAGAEEATVRGKELSITVEKLPVLYWDKRKAIPRVGPHPWEASSCRETNSFKGMKLNLKRFPAPQGQLPRRVCPQGLHMACNLGAWLHLELAAELSSIASIVDMVLLLKTKMQGS